MATNVAVSTILDGMVAALAPIVPTPGHGVSAAKYVRHCSRYAGELTSREAGRRGAAGRTPAVLVAYQGERTLSTTIGRRVDKVEGTFAAVCITDAESDRDRRAFITACLQDVQRLLGARRLGLAIQPLVIRGNRIAADDELMLAHVIDITTRYRRDYTKDPGADRMLTFDGEIFEATAPVGTPKWDVEGTYP